MLGALKKSACIDPTVIQQRNASVSRQLCDKRLYSTDVVPDGNCLFRAISLCVHGQQSKHAELRSVVVHHLLQNADSIFKSSCLSTEDVSALRSHVQPLLMDGEWVGEECLLAAADFLRREVHVFVSAVNISPIVYSPAIEPALHQPIALAFYEPGHYCSVSSVPLNFNGR
jgi:OTU-like cysteine protease